MSSTILKKYEMRDETATTASACHEIDIMRFASYRRNEIELLMSDSFLGKPKAKVNKSLFQLLPRHMRRRTMGFIRKRLPHRIRQAAVMKTPTTKSNKRPSRKYRRKPSNLLDEYERRQRAATGRTWLETHIWHAKRFHMSNAGVVSSFGYRLALFDNCKSKRPVYRGLKSGCCIHDESYFVCHELTARQDILINGLNRLCSPNLGLTFAARMLIDGRFEGRIILYEADKYPFGCIGPCRFLWKSQENNSNDISTRTIWIWTHPSVYLQVQNELIKIWNMSKSSNSNDRDDESPKLKKIKLTFPSSGANVTAQKTSINENDAKSKDENASRKFNSLVNDEIVEMNCLKDELVRFKMLGPLSTTILNHVLHVFESSNMNEQEVQMYESQISIWNKIKSSIRDPNEITNSAVLGLLVKDPRLVLPKKKSFKQMYKQNDAIDSRVNQHIKQEINQQLKNSIFSYSTIWDRSVIDRLNASKKNTHEINKIRAEYLLPGTRLSKLENHSKIPILLIQNGESNGVHGLNSQSMLAGWDLIIPKSWAMPFWMCFVHFGARAIAQHELSYLYFESGNLKFPNEFIDTVSSRMVLEKLKIDLASQHKSRPSSKRVNYLKNQFMTPFYAPIRSLLSLSLGMNQLVDNDKYFILRDRKLISKLKLMLFQKTSKSKSVPPPLDEQEIELTHHSYVAVRLQCDKRGTLGAFSLLFKQEFQTTNESTATASWSSRAKPVLAKILDCHRKQAILAAEKERIKKKISDEKSKTPAIELSSRILLNKLIQSKYDPNDVLLDEKYFLELLRNLDLTVESPPIGFVLSGGFNFACAKCTANGYILTRDLFELANAENKLSKGLVVRVYSPTTPSNNEFITARITHVFH